MIAQYLCYNWVNVFYATLHDQGDTMKKLILVLLSLSVLGCSESPQVSEKRQVARSDNPGALPLTSEGRSPFVSIAKKLMPAVVSIEAERIEQVRSPHGFFEAPSDLFFRGLFPEFPQRRREVRRPVLGSGVIVSDDGYILTNNHVVEKAVKIVVRTSDEKEYAAKLVGTDQMTDIALVKIDASGLKCAKLGNSDNMEVGDWVMAIGNPFHLMGTVTAGIISAKGRRIEGLPGGSPQIQNFLQTDAAINPGNSGGPLVNLQGEVVGINTAIKTAGRPGNIGIGFAIPSNMAKRVMDDLIQYKEVKRGWLGVRWGRVSAQLAEAYGLDEPMGVLVVQVTPESPAEKADIKSEDVILEWGGKKVDHANFLSLVSETEIDKKINVKLWRNKKIMFVQVKVEMRPSDEQELAGSWFGLKILSLSSKEAQRFRMGEKEGVLVAEVEPGCVASLAGVRPGDIIKKIGDLKIENPSDYGRARKKYKDTETSIAFKLRRGDHVAIVALKK
jgi:serine protease Do